MKWTDLFDCEFVNGFCKWCGAPEESPELACQRPCIWCGEMTISYSEEWSGPLHEHCEAALNRSYNRWLNTASFDLAIRNEEGALAYQLASILHWPQHIRALRIAYCEEFDEHRWVRVDDHVLQCKDCGELSI